MKQKEQKGGKPEPDEPQDARIPVSCPGHGVKYSRAKQSNRLYSAR